MQVAPVGVRCVLRIVPTGQSCMHDVLHQRQVQCIYTMKLTSEKIPPVKRLTADKGNGTVCIYTDTQTRMHICTTRIYPVYDTQKMPCVYVYVHIVRRFRSLSSLSPSLHHLYPSVFIFVGTPGAGSVLLCMCVDQVREEGARVED